MPPNQRHPLAATFDALSEPTRLAIVERLLAEGERSVGQLAEPFELSAPAISKHLAVLERAGVIERRVERQWRLCRVRPQALAAIADWMGQYRRFWDGSFDRLETLIENSNEGNKDHDER